MMCPVQDPCTTPTLPPTSRTPYSVNSLLHSGHLPSSILPNLSVDKELSISSNSLLVTPSILLLSPAMELADCVTTYML